MLRWTATDRIVCTIGGTREVPAGTTRSLVTARPRPRRRDLSRGGMGLWLARRAAQPRGH